MWFRYSLVCLLLVMASCTSWETKKVSTQEILHQKWETISLNEVEEYPSFKTCDTTATRLDHKKCFEGTIQQTLSSHLAYQTLIVTKPILDTVWIDFMINEKGKFCLDSLRIPLTVHQELPRMEIIIQDAIVQLPIARPATKRGIPVRAQFKIPLVLKVD